MSEQEKANEQKQKQEGGEPLVQPKWLAFLSLVWRKGRSFFLPLRKMSRALFYPPTYDESGKPNRSHFSLTRFFLILGFAVLLLRLLFGGSIFTGIRVGSPVNVKTVIAPPSPEMLRLEKQKGATLPRKIVKESRGWVDVQKMESKPLTLYELAGFILLFLAYYLRNKLNKGDTGGFFEKALAVGIGILRSYDKSPQARQPAQQPVPPPVEVEKPTSPPITKEKEDKQQEKADPPPTFVVGYPENRKGKQRKPD